MAQHDVLPEDHVAPARAEQQRIQRLAQHEPGRTRSGLREKHHELVAEQRTEAGPADDQRLILRARRHPGTEQVVLRPRDSRPPIAVP